MRGFNPIRAFFVFLILIPFLIFPFFLKVYYSRFISWLFHLPLILFGRIAGILMKSLNIKPEDILEKDE